MISAPECMYCDKPITHEDLVAYQVVGYEYPRTKGGANVIHLRTRTGNVAHRRCVERAKHEQPGQAAIFE